MYYKLAFPTTNLPKKPRSKASLSQKQKRPPPSEKKPERILCLISFFVN